MPTLYLVDGSSYLYRAFHALPDLRTSRGEPTGAIRGVISMLRRLVEDGKPDQFAVVFDAPGKTFRDDWYPQYKATRTALPDDLAQLIEPRVTVVNTMSNETLDVQSVVAKFGVRADQILDLLTLTGDAVDNVPGVAKVGPKTAAKWLAEYGTLDE